MTVTTSDLTVATRLSVGDRRGRNADALVDETLTVTVLNTAINGDTAQIVVSETGVGDGCGFHDQ